MLKNLLKGFVMNDRVFIVCVTIAFMALVGSITFYHYEELKAMQSNVESAIVKGIDPITVRCVYGKSADSVCVAYAASHSDLNSIPSKK